MVVVPPLIGATWLKEILEIIPPLLTCYAPKACIRMEGDTVQTCEAKAKMLLMEFKSLRDAIIREKGELRSITLPRTEPRRYRGTWMEDSSPSSPGIMWSPSRT